MTIIENIQCTIQFSNDSTEYTIDESDIIDDDVTITSQCCDDNTFSLGGVYSSQLTMTFRASGFTTNTFDIRGAKITVKTKYGSDNDFIQRGVFWVTSATRNRDVYNVSASDSMIWLDNIPLTDSIADSLTLDLESYVRTLTVLANRIVLGTNAILLGMPCSTEGDITNSIERLGSGEVTPIFKYEYPRIYVNNAVEDAGFRHYHKDDMSVETSPREHLGFVAQIYGGFAYSLPNGNITFGRFFRDIDEKSENAFTISKDRIELDTLNVSSQYMRFSPVKATTNSGYYSTKWFTNNDNTSIVADVVLENNPYLDGFHAEGTDEKFKTIVNTLFNVLNYTSVKLNENNITIDGSNATSINIFTRIRPFSIKCHTEHRFTLGEHVVIPTGETDTTMVETTLTKIVWTFRGGYELGCTGGDTRMLSDSYKNSQAKKVQRMLERKINYYR